MGLHHNDKVGVYKLWYLAALTTIVSSHLFFYVGMVGVIPLFITFGCVYEMCKHLPVGSEHWFWAERCFKRGED